MSNTQAVLSRQDFPTIPMQSDFDHMGLTNNFWGICGINSSLYALYLHCPRMQARLGRGGLTPSAMLGSIKAFLRVLQSEGKQTMLDDIENFTKTFNGFGKWNLKDYITKIDAAARVVDAGVGLDVLSSQPSYEKKAQLALLSDPMFSIGLPPDAVVHYLQRMCGFDNAKQVPLNAAGDEFIVGLYRDEGNNMNICGGLKHYVYYKNLTYYSWGKSFSNINEMKRNYGGICYKIEF